MYDRRFVLGALGAAAALGPRVMSAASGPERSGVSGAHAAPIEIALLMYPGFFGQDLVGPYTVFALLPGARVHLVAASRDAIRATPGEFPILPNATFEECPRDLDLLLVPGGAFSTVNAMKDEATVAFVRDRGARARYVTSVCTGSLILGAAGLLKGYKATSHWLTWDLLPHFGAIPTRGRVVIDRNRITGGGVTAGIDFGLSIAAMLAGKEMAQAAQLIIEYDPEPPFDAGSPERAPANVKRMVDERYAPFMDAVRAAVAQLSGQD